MATFKIIQQKLESFIRKYYTNELIRGTILFLAIGLLYFLITLLVEYFLWLNPSGRKLLFWVFILVELALFIRFIAFPLTKLFKLRKGIDHDEASRIIGRHFPEVNDKLLNVIQLSRNKDESELLAASIDQKAAELQPIPFTKAIRFQENLKYLKYVAIPVLVFLLISTLGDSNIFSSSYDRVLNYNVAYEPPAPFSFVVLNDDLNAIENTSFTLKVRTDGNVVPENVSILFDKQLYYMQQLAPGEFEYTFQEPIDPIKFQLKSNKVHSREYLLDVIKTPSLADFEMELNFPRHTRMEPQTIKSTGNATIPEGTQVKWKVAARNTEEIHLKTDDSLYSFSSKGDRFEFQNTIYRKLDYTVSTSNNRLKEYENLSYSLNVIKDEYPDIQVQSKKDSTDIERVLFLGSVSDDYGLTKLQLVYYPTGEEDQAEVEQLPVNTSNFDQFSFEFPGDLTLKEGISYEYYFQVFDNDAIHNFKSSKSGVFYFRKLTQSEIESEQLEKQSETIQNLDRSLQELQENKETFEELSRTQKEKTELNYNDKKKLESFLQRQRQQEEMMRNFSEQMKEELEDFQPEEEDPFKDALKERLDENEKRLEENEKLLNELEKLQDKIQQEELIQRLDNLGKERKKQERNLEQLVELTKRFYVKKKAEKIAQELQNLGERQEDLAKKDADENTKEAQEELNEAFQNLMEELEKLQEENEGLKSPMDIPEDQQLEEEIQSEQEDATEKLQDGKPQDASPSQQKAGQKMKQMGNSIESQMKGGDMETLEEDIEMLRQILSNLIVFSFEQESLMLEFRNIEYGSPNYGEKLKVQNELKTNFEHVDDSLYALSIRQPVIGDAINSILIDIEYNLDKSLEQLAQNKSGQGLRNQQYVMTGANDLAVLLDDLLSNLNMQLSMAAGAGSGEGKPSPGSSGGKFQLPDIIKSQEELIEEMSQGMGQGQGQGEGEGEDGEGQESGQPEGEGGSEGEGQGEGDGQSGGSNEGEGKGEGEGEGDYWNDEGMSGELFEIYKQQQKLRQELEMLIKEEGLDGHAGNLLKDMQRIEQQLLERGFNKGTVQDMLLLKYELMKLDEAFYQQGQDEKRQATTNRNDFKNTKRMSQEEIKSYFNTTEILNREALPLRNNYQIKVQKYFKTRDD